MKIKLECVVFYNDNFFVDVELPDDIKFYEFYRYNDKQRFYTTIYKKDDGLCKELIEKTYGRSRNYTFGDYMILELRQCHPVNEDLPLISLDDLNNMFNEHIKGYYIKSERISTTKTIEKNKDNKIELFEDDKPMEIGSDFLHNVYRSLNPTYYTEYIARPLGFVDRTCEDLSMKFGTVCMYSCLGDDFHQHVHGFTVDIRKISMFEKDYTHGQKITISNSKEIAEEYKNEIIKLLDMDNYDHVDYRTL